MAKLNCPLNKAIKGNRSRYYCKKCDIAFDNYWEFEAHKCKDD